MALGAIAEIRCGWGFPNVYQSRGDGTYPFYKVSDMNLVDNEMIMTTANNYVSEGVKEKLGVNPAPAGTVIFPKIGAAIATNIKRLLSAPSAYDNNVMGLIPGYQISPRFLFSGCRSWSLLNWPMTLGPFHQSSNRIWRTCVFRFRH